MIELGVGVRTDTHNVTALRALFMRILPTGTFKRILLKPNLVMHQSNPQFPITAMVTDTRIIHAAIAACLDKYPTIESLIVGDAPLQSCDWDLLLQQTGLSRLMERFERYRLPRVSFVDLRKEKFRCIDGYLMPDDREGGDPSGYREVVLDHESFLDPISAAKERFRVSDYDHQLTISQHRSGVHRYVIAGSVLEADLVVNLPKMKTHQKAGITGALKNLVGINGDKASLVHYRLGDLQRGGDEYPPDVPWEVRGSKSDHVGLLDLLAEDGRCSAGLRA